MIISIVVFTSILFSLSIGFIIGKVRSLEYFKEAVEVYRSVQIPETPRSKGDVRRIRRYRLMVKTAKRRMLLLFLTQFSVFIGMYVLMLLTVITIASWTGVEWVEIPVAIPLLSVPLEEGGFTTHVTFISILAFALPLYFVNKKVKLSEEPSPP
ncbi:7tm Odorant receptor [Thermosphaera chiliense]|mgnify:CR=1 FL=1|uniref:7tm Odorant receptor n=1 Tax=Thermosphaera chiliense TaxID=3402707 RepID=A0A7M1US00_9CREN|nr:7tm Odorant receptor [Thermosphaera aggregans]QOR94749.1 7tm Odorant receptor [Thermosphaera aggregans]